MSRKELDVEINLIPFISLLSVLICALLLSAVWVHIGAISVKQAVGGQPASESKEPPSIMTKMSAKGDLVLSVMNPPRRFPRKLLKQSIKGLEGAEPNVEELLVYIKALKEKSPEIETALIYPNSATSYDSMIQVMDQFKSEGVNDLGVSPL